MMKFFLTGLTVLLIGLFLLPPSFSQITDSIVFNSSNVLIGEIKSLKTNVLKVETDYSDSDFLIEWNKVKYIKSDQSFIITFSKGNPLNGSVKTDPADPGKLIITKQDGSVFTTDFLNVVFLKPVEKSFISRLDLLLSAGYNLTKANNNHQFNIRANAGYLSNTFGSDIYFNAIRSIQTVDDTLKTSTTRTEGGLNLSFFVVRDWFVLAATDLLQSDELQLSLRALTKLGMGNFIMNTHQQYFVLSGGGAWNFENYTPPEQTDRNSLEAFITAEYKIFNIGDLDFLTSISAYPGITEWGRIRSDFVFDLKYEFVNDFFINLGFTLNYDNMPIEGASGTDYVLQTSIGWEL